MKLLVRRRAFSLFAAAVCCATFPTASTAADWPTAGGDIRRTNVSADALALPLVEGWRHAPPHAPRPAWPESPAKQDVYRKVYGLSPTVTFDRAFQPVIAQGRLYYGSSADDAVRCLDAASGKPLWAYVAEGPVRLAPTVHSGKVYFGSDDGCVYCLEAADGSLVWKHRPVEPDRRLPGNGRIISATPARTGVVVDNGIAYYFSGLFPELAVYRCALDAETGAPVWVEKTEGVSPQGYLLASPQRLFVPTGRTNPAIFERVSSKPLGQLPSGGGTYAVLVDDALASGPSRTSGNTLQLSDPNTSEGIATCDGVRMVVSGPIAYIQSKTELSALDRPKYLALGRQRNEQSALRKQVEDQLKAAKDNRDAAEIARLKAELEKQDGILADFDARMRACYLWRQPNDLLDALILAGDTLFTGGDGRIAAFAKSDGAQRWNTEAPGRIYGLSAAGGRLYASTDTGAIICFGAESESTRVIEEATDTPGQYAEDASRYAEAAERVLAESGITKGYCLVLGAGEGGLAYALAQRSQLNIVGVESDPAEIAAGRTALDRAGLYGTRITLQHVEGTQLPYTTYMADLVVSEEALTTGTLSIPSAEVFRVLRPYGGTACIGSPASGAGPSREALARWLEDGGAPDTEIKTDGGFWAVMRRGSVAGAGEWTQLYANSGHTASSTEQLKGPVEIQWFGEPGPRDIVDRHHRPMSPLFKDGRLFVPADNLVIALNPYNGTPLWQLPVPDSRRVGVIKNSGQMLLTDDLLYIARMGECWSVEPATGKHVHTFKAPQLDNDGHDWGYLDCEDGHLIGTAQKPGASFNLLAVDTINALEGDYRPVIVSQYLFSLDRRSGKQQWLYRKGAIMNGAIAVDNGRIYFVESRN